MKKTIFTTVLLFVAAFSFAQKDSVKAKQDTTIQISMSLDQFRLLLYSIDQNIDSKKVSKDLLEFLQKSAAIKQDKKEKP